MSRIQSQAPRSWSEIDEPVKRRPLVIAGLFLLLIAGVAATLWWYWPESTRRVYAFGYSIDQVGEEHFPRPAFARWDLSSTSFNTWSPWQRSHSGDKAITVVDKADDFCETIRGETDLNRIDDKIQEDFRKSGASEKDSLIIYLRGLSVVTQGHESSPQPQLLLLAPDATASEAIPKGMPLEKLLKSLTNTKAANVIVLADIADLTRVPQIGLLDNDISAALDLLMKEGLDGDGTGDTPVWLILPRGDGQPNYVSYLTRKTLLQSSAEYALSKAPAADSPGYLPLTNFFEAILRYSHHVTNGDSDNVTVGAQLPQLFRNGSGLIQDIQSDFWKEAETVPLAMSSSAIPDSDKRPQESPSEENGESQTLDGKTAVELDDPAFQPTSPHFVSTFLAQSQPNGDKSGKASTPPTTADVGTASSQGAKSVGNTGGDDSLGPSSASGSVGSSVSEASAAIVAQEDRDPWLRFWRLRDELARREATIGDLIGWSPADFAIDKWQKIQNAALQKQRLFLLDASDEKPRKELEQNLIRSLEDLKFGSFIPTNDPQASESLPAAWEAFRKSIDDPYDNRRSWLDEELLASDLRQSWIEQRSKLRELVDLCWDASTWMELYLEQVLPGTQVLSRTQPAIDELSVLRVKIDKTIESILVLKERLSKRGTLLDPPTIDLSDLGNILKVRQELKLELDRIVSDSKQLLESQDKRLTWRNEKTIQVLLSSPILSHVQRTSLEVYYSSPQTLVSRLFHLGVDGDYDERIELQKLLDPPSVAGSSIALNNNWEAWGKRMEAGEEKVDKWFRTCFAVLWPVSKRERASSAAGGLMMPVSNDMELSVVQPDSRLYQHRLPQPLTVELRHRNGTRMDNCWLDWKHSSSDDSSRFQLRALQGGEELPFENPKKVNLSSDKFLLEFQPFRTGTIVPIDGIPIELRLARQKEELERAEIIKVLILPQAQNRIDLFVRRWDFSRKELEPDAHRTELEEDNPVLRDVIRVPAINHQAKAQYQLYLCNRFDQTRIVRARLFYADSRLHSGDGKITFDAIDRTRSKDVNDLQLIASVERIELPRFEESSGTLPKNSQRLDLVLPPEEANPVKLEPKNQGAFGLLLYIEDAPPTEGSSSTPVTGDPQFIWLDGISSTPYPVLKPSERLVDIKPTSPANGYEVDFEVSVLEETLIRWDIEKLDVSIQLTNENRERMANRNDIVVTLNRERPKATLRIDPDIDSLPSAQLETGQPSKIVVHFSIEGYPRAAAFEYSHNGKVSSFTEAFLRLEPSCSSGSETGNSDPSSDLKLSQVDIGELPVPCLDNEGRTFFIPNRIEATQEVSGKSVTPDRLVVPFQVDFPRLTNKYSARIALGSDDLSELSHDRQFKSQIGVEKGMLAFRSSAQDYQYEIPDFASKRNKLQGKYGLKVSVIGGNIQNDGKSEDEIFFVLDKEKPKKSQIKMTSPVPGRLYEGENLRVEMTSDEDDIRVVYFAINRPETNNRKPIYDSRDYMVVEALPVGGKWITDFKPTEELKAPFDYDVVARSIDWSGNVQDEHDSAKFRWLGKKSTPPAKPKKSGK